MPLAAVAAGTVGAPDPTPRLAYATRAERLALLDALPAPSRARLCAFLRVDYDIFPWYERPPACGG